MQLLWYFLAAMALVSGALALAAERTRRQRSTRDRELAAARAEFQLRREWLEAEFFRIASQSGMPRGLSWVDCDFDSPVAFARDRVSGELCALVGLTISFEATEGGGMEHVEAVSNLRAATALFRKQGAQWLTDGRARFNLRPEQVIERYSGELEQV